MDPKRFVERPEHFSREMLFDVVVKMGRFVPDRVRRVKGERRDVAGFMVEEGEVKMEEEYGCGFLDPEVDA